MRNLGKKTILVEITDTDDTTYFKKCAIGTDGKIQINPKGGRGKENPNLPQTYFYKRGLLGFGWKRYARYRLLSGRFMNRLDDDLPPISRRQIQDWINSDTYNAHFGTAKTSLISYVTLAGIAILFLFLVVLPRIG